VKEIAVGRDLTKEEEFLSLRVKKFIWMMRRRGVTNSKNAKVKYKRHIGVFFMPSIRYSG
jgi:hypothetical protein